MADTKLFGLLSFARRAGKLTLGFDAVVEDAQKGKAKLILICSDLSEKTGKNLSYELTKTPGIPVRRMHETMQDFLPITKKPTGIFAVCDESFASGMLRALDDVQP